MWATVYFAASLGPCPNLSHHESRSVQTHSMGRVQPARDCAERSHNGPSQHRKVPSKDALLADRLWPGEALDALGPGWIHSQHIGLPHKSREGAEQVEQRSASGCGHPEKQPLAVSDPG